MGRRRKGDTTPTQSELAKTLGVSRRTVQRWEKQRIGQTKGNTRVRVDLLAARAAFRRAAQVFKEQGGFTKEDWEVAEDLHRHVALLLYPED